jgi:hypothetical protein
MQRISRSFECAERGGGAAGRLMQLGMQVKILRAQGTGAGSVEGDATSDRLKAVVMIEPRCKKLR